MRETRWRRDGVAIAPHSPWTHHNAFRGRRARSNREICKFVRPGPRSGGTSGCTAPPESCGERSEMDQRGCPVVVRQTVRDTPGGAETDSGSAGSGLHRGACDQQ